MRVTLLTLLCSLQVALGGAFAIPQETLQQGLETYAEALETTDTEARSEAFFRAELLFQRVADAGMAGADLYANIGTAALQAERLGPAILAFRRALQLEPSHTRAAQNLDHARSLLPAWVPQPTRDEILDDFFFWHRSMSPDQRAAAAAICFFIAAGCISVAIRRRSTLARNLAILVLFAWIALIASMITTATATTRPAVVIVDEIAARAADSPNAPSRFAEPLPGGSEVEVMEDRGEWVRIALANGREAWVRASGLAYLSINVQKRSESSGG